MTEKITCNSCNNQFTTLKRLQNHIQRFHNGTNNLEETEYKCIYCNSIHITKGNLKRHQLICKYKLIHDQESKVKENKEKELEKCKKEFEITLNDLSLKDKINTEKILKYEVDYAEKEKALVDLQNKYNNMVNKYEEDIKGLQTKYDTAVLKYETHIKEQQKEYKELFKSLVNLII